MYICCSLFYSLLMKLRPLLLLLALLLCSCTKESIQTLIDPNSTSIELEVNGETLTIPLNNETTHFDAITLNSEFDNKFVLKNPSQFNSVTINGETLNEGDTVRIKLDKISYKQDIKIEYNIANQSGVRYIRTLNSKIPALTTSGKSPYKGDYYLSFTGNRLIIKIDQMGNIVYYRCVWSAYGHNFEEPPGYWDFKKHTIGDKIYYSFHERDVNYIKLQTNGYSPGAQVIMDEQYNIIDRIYLTGNGIIAQDEPTEGHDFYMIDRNHYILSNYVLRIVSPEKFPNNIECNPLGSKVLSSYLQEVVDGKVVFEWWSVDHKELFALSDTENFPASNFDYMNRENHKPDYIHFNSITVDPKDGNWICSFRYISTIIKINSKTGDIIWKLSGKGDEFGLTEQQKTHGQHYARLASDGSITAFDNHNGTPNMTRIVKYRINEQNKKLIEFKEYSDVPYYTFACGSAMLIDPIQDVFVIGWGLSESNEQRIVSEINFTTKEKYFEITAAKDGLYSTSTYRSVKYE